MSHSYSRIWIHAIWSTKARLPLITPEIEKILFMFVAEQLKDLGCMVGIINGMPDHIHCLFLQNPQKSVSEIMKQLKGSSSYFINQQNILDENFAWQTGYASFSVSESNVEKVFNYIKYQKQHHQKLTFQNEYEEFIKPNYKPSKPTPSTHSPDYTG